MPRVMTNQSEINTANSDLISEEQLLAALSYTARLLTRAIESRRMFFVSIDGKRLFPAFYADQRYDRKHLGAISKCLGELSGGSKLQFFQTPKGSLGGLTPLQAICLGQFASVKVAAEGFAHS